MSDDWYALEYVSTLCRMFRRLSLSENRSTRESTHDIGLITHENHANIMVTYARPRAF